MAETPDPLAKARRLLEKRLSEIDAEVETLRGALDHLGSGSRSKPSRGRRRPKGA